MSDSEKPLDHYSFDSYLKKQNLEVKRSTISGYGLHSRKSIPKGINWPTSFYDQHRYYNTKNISYLLGSIRWVSQHHLQLLFFVQEVEELLKVQNPQILRQAVSICWLVFPSWCSHINRSIHKYECNVMSALNVSTLWASIHVLDQAPILWRITIMSYSTIVG